MSFIACNSVVISTCFYQAILRFRGHERPDIESTLETPRVPPSRECTCVISEQLTAISLTDISGHSYNLESDSHGVLDTLSGRSLGTSAASSQNSRSQQSSSGSENSSSNYSTSQNSNSQYTSSQFTGSESSRSQGTQSTTSSRSGSYRSQRTGSQLSSQRSLSTFDSYISSNHSA